MICKHCGTQVADDNAFCTNCGATLPKKHLKISPADGFFWARKFLLSHRVIAIVLCIALLIGMVGICTNWFGLNGPAVQIANAVRKTLTAKSLTVDFTVSAATGSGLEKDTRKISGKAQICLDLKHEEITLFLTVKGLNGETVEYAIYDGYLLTMEEGRVYKEDISDKLDAFFEAYEDAQERAKEMIKNGQVDWKELLETIDEDAYETAQEHVNFTKLNGCISQLAKNMNSPAWLRKNAGYHTSLRSNMKVHTFQPDICEFLEAVLPIFRPAFRDRDDYTELEESLEKLDEDLGNTDLSLVFGIRGSKLRMLELELALDSQQISANLEFSKIGHTRIDTNKLDDLLDEAKEY